MGRKWRNSWRNTAESSSSILQQRGTASFSNTPKTSSGMARIFFQMEPRSFSVQSEPVQNEIPFRILALWAFCANRLMKILQKVLAKLPVICGLLLFILQKAHDVIFSKIGLQKSFGENGVQILRGSSVCHAPYNPVLKPVYISLSRDQSCTEVSYISF